VRETPTQRRLRSSRVAGTRRHRARRCCHPTTRDGLPSRQPRFSILFSSPSTVVFRLSDHQISVRVIVGRPRLTRVFLPYLTRSCSSSAARRRVSSAYGRIPTDGLGRFGSEWGGRVRPIVATRHFFPRGPWDPMTDTIHRHSLGNSW